ncbi:tRNA glutamyl-Q(34) synthetase GluQRS, partial [Ectothiorhodospiraceae bacterium WFHF3C12]|nr:tRNA glutamyl-Q(34) synthetase GluQRS [Ectothiorhodospiraceae bacterium WFHF3C12]
PRGRQARAWRVRTAGRHLHLTDRLQSDVTCDLHETLGDFIIRRGDGLFAYHLACVVDDAEAGITEIVRGSDLLWSTLPQIHLQGLLDLPRPAYAHLPVAVNDAGNKLSKQTFAAPLDHRHAPQLLIAALRFLGQTPPPGLVRADPAEILAWAVASWREADIPRDAAPAPELP